MVDQNSKQFAQHVIARILESVVTGFDAGNTTEFLTHLSTKIPGLDINQFSKQSPDQWQHSLVPRIVDYYADNYQPGKLKTAV